MNHDQSALNINAKHIYITSDRKELNESDFIVQDVVLWYTLKVWFSDRFKQK